VFLSNEINFNREIDCFYLLYDGESLVSFLSLFVLLQDEAEVSAYTLPDFRKRGYFHTLFEKAAEELKKYGIAKVLFVCEPAGRAALKVLKTYGAGLSHSEYRMAYESGDYRKSDSSLRLEPASQNHLAEMAALDSLLFDCSHEESLSQLNKSLASENIKSFGAFLGGKLVGVCSASFQDDGATIYGIGISPECQGNGYGRELLNLLLEQILLENPCEISLEVSSTNTVAYQLYRTNGFHVKTQYDYYAYSV
jgi:ribosomal protein S18 acetylase RimI-like enzyme